MLKVVNTESTPIVLSIDGTIITLEHNGVCEIKKCSFKVLKATYPALQIVAEKEKHTSAPAQIVTKKPKAKKK